MLTSSVLALLVLALLSSTTFAAAFEAMSQGTKLADAKAQKTAPPTSAETSKKSKSASSPYGVPTVSKGSSSPDNSSDATTASASDDETHASASEWDMHHNETSEADLQYDMSTPSNSTMILPAEPDTTQSATLVVLSIFTFLALALCTAIGLQHISKQNNRRQRYEEIGNIVV
jgi:hypothetical protein